MDETQRARETGAWWALALRALAAIILGIIALTRPGIVLGGLVIMFGIYAMADGIFAVIAALRGVRYHERWGWMLFEGVVSIIAGLIALFYPGIGVLTLVWLVAAWALVTGVLEIAAAITLRKSLSGEWRLVLGGILSILLAVFIAVRPGIGVAVLAVWVGIYALIYGVVTMALAMRVRKWSHAESHAP